MSKKELIEATVNNSIVLMQKAAEHQDKELFYLAQITLTAAAAVMHGDIEELSDLVSDFIDGKIAEENPNPDEMSVPKSLQDLLKKSNISLN